MRPRGGCGAFNNPTSTLRPPAPVISPLCTLSGQGDLSCNRRGRMGEDGGGKGREDRIQTCHSAIITVPKTLAWLWFPWKHLLHIIHVFYSKIHVLWRQYEGEGDSARGRETGREGVGEGGRRGGRMSGTGTTLVVCTQSQTNSCVNNVQWPELSVILLLIHCKHIHYYCLQ